MQDADGGLRRLSAFLRPRRELAVVQLAADGEWESCRRTPLAALDVDAGSALLRTVSHTARHDVGLEVWWPGHGFIGLRWRRRESDEAVSGLERLLEAATADPVDLLEAAAGGPLGPVTFAEVGAVNAWRSIGPQTVWRRDCPIDVATSLRRRPELMSCRFPVAVEFAADTPRSVWLAVEVSTSDGERHRLDEHRLGECLTAVG
jgi:hypothetical protein